MGIWTYFKGKLPNNLICALHNDTHSDTHKEISKERLVNRTISKKNNS